MNPLSNHADAARYPYTLAGDAEMRRELAMPVYHFDPVRLDPEWHRINGLAADASLASQQWGRLAAWLIDLDNSAKAMLGVMANLTAEQKSLVRRVRDSVGVAVAAAVKEQERQAEIYLRLKRERDAA